MSVTLIGYDRCATCRRAEKFLKERGIQYTRRSIVEQRPTKEELLVWKQNSGVSWRRFFNSTGQLYRSHHLSGKINGLLEAEILDILSSDGMWLKRPILITDHGVSIGFNEIDWLNLLEDRQQ